MDVMRIDLKIMIIMNENILKLSFWKRENKYKINYKWNKNETKKKQINKSKLIN